VIGKIERVALREVWRHEALDFTTWLEESLDVLNDVLDITLSGAEREQSAGSFSVDLVAETNRASRCHNRHRRGSNPAMPLARQSTKSPNKGGY